MRSSLFAAASLIFAIGCVAPPVQGDHHALRPVSGRVLTSAAMPAVRIEFGEGFRYVGGQDFVLYEVANAEQHFFVDGGADGRVTRLYWVQFEGYLPTNTHSYDYDSQTKVDIGGLEFVADAFPANIASQEGRPDSDGARARAFLTAKGLKMASDDIMMQRLVHLVDKEKRNELMIIYAEALNGTPPAEAAKGLLDRAVKGIKITR